MNKSENINEIAMALAKMQATLTGAIKDANNPFFHANYADLESIWQSIRKPLTDNGLAIVQVGGFEGDKYTLITMLTHTSGQWISGSMAINPVKSDPQSLGSALTYMRRYGVAAIVGQVQVDDDGNVGSDKTKKTDVQVNPQGKPDRIESQAAMDLKDKTLITEPMAKRLFAIKSKVGMPDDVLKQGLEKLGVKSSKELNRKQYDYLVKEVENWKP
jgi:hypothetical protein